MIKSIKKNYKRVFCILASVIIAVVSVFMFLPKDKISAKALGSDTEPGVTVVKLDKYPINYAIAEYYSVNNGNGIYIAPSSYISFELSSEGFVKFKVNQDLRIRGNDRTYNFLALGAFEYSSSYSSLSSIPIIDYYLFYSTFTNSTNDYYGFSFNTRWIFDKYMMSYPGVLADYSSQFPLRQYYGYLSSYDEIFDNSVVPRESYSYFFDLSLYSPYRDTLRERDILAFVEKSASQSVVNGSVKNFSTLTVSYSHFNVHYSNVHLPVSNLNVNISLPVIYFTFFGNTENDWVRIGVPSLHEINGNVTLAYAINNGVVDVDSVAYLNGYNVGFQAAREQLYDDVYDSGFNAGERSGYNKGYEKGASSNNTFLNLFTAVVDAPVQVFTDMFDFEILGVNMSEFFLSLLSLCIITMVIRWFI